MNDHSNFKRSNSYWPRLKEAARDMRRKPTEAERLLWRALRGRKLNGFKFRRQHPIDRFAVDFCCSEARMVIELDGPVHDSQQIEDKQRQDALERLAYRVHRITNDRIVRELDTILGEIRSALHEFSRARSVDAADPPLHPGG